MVLHMLSLSAQLLLRLPWLLYRPVLLSHPKQEVSSLDTLEWCLVEQVGMCRHPPLPHPLPFTDEANSLPSPIPTPIPVLGKRKGSTGWGGTWSTGVAVNKSAVLILAVGAEEDFGGPIISMLIAEPEGHIKTIEFNSKDILNQPLSHMTKPR
ncbi:hypothetical protein EI94DRAFT_1802778 [Lactarius quietus]|nr:hypothetical protein EI94DRAFT_1802778 [Lactarius quietus]